MNEAFSSTWTSKAPCQILVPMRQKPSVSQEVGQDGTVLGAPRTILSAFFHLELGPDLHPLFLLRSASWGAPEDEPPGWVSASGPPPLYATVFSSVRLEKSHIPSASGIPHSIIQHRVHGSRVPSHRRYQTADSEPGCSLAAASS